MQFRASIYTIVAVLLAVNCATIDGLSLQCTYGLVYYNQLGNLYTCTANVILGGNENVTAVTGTHQTGKGHGDVQGMWLGLRNLQFMPSNIGQFFPNIIAIEAYSNSITTISNRHLNSFPNLRFISMWGNRITSIDGDLFDGMNSLIWIAFNNNSLTHVGHDLNLPSSAWVYLYSNPCTNETAESPNQIASLKLNLLRNCPPTIAQIEHSLEKRQNLFTHIGGHVESLIKTTYEMNNEVATLLNDQVALINMVFQLTNRISYLEEIIRNVIGAEVVVDEHGQSN